MKCYCLKEKRTLYPTYSGATKIDVKGMVFHQLGEDWQLFLKRHPGYSIVKVEIKEIT